MFHGHFYLGLGSKGARLCCQQLLQEVQLELATGAQGVMTTHRKTMSQPPAAGRGVTNITPNKVWNRDSHFKSVIGGGTKVQGAPITKGKTCSPAEFPKRSPLPRCLDATRISAATRTPTPEGP